MHRAPPVDLEVDTDDGHWVHISVSDSDPSLPAVPTQLPTSTQEGGRGIAIVEALSQQWGLTTTSDGKQVVWCEMLNAEPALGYMPPRLCAHSIKPPTLDAEPA